ncbi:hypothetical protein [Pseudomonas amygdali]|uniref:hypothetical protein n=1 Tax=Pseudomonas amygdali TaxID=47877 RepID=UPI0011C3BF7C|nr:hypothetical protein [Pseudomonas amygdali]
MALSIDNLSSTFGANGSEIAGFRFTISAINEWFALRFSPKEPEKGQKTRELQNLGNKKPSFAGWAFCKTI